MALDKFTQITKSGIVTTINFECHHLYSTGIATFSSGNISAGGNVTAVDGIFSGNVSVGGTLTYQDVTNIDSVGLVTARTGVRVTAGGIDVTAGVSTFAALIDANGGVDISGGSGLVASTAKISDLTDNRVVIGGSSGELEDSANLTFDGSNLGVGSKVTVTNANADADNPNSLGAEINAAWIRLGDVTAAKSFSNGLGIKFYDQGTAHWSAGTIGNKFYIAQTSNDGNKLFPSGRTDAVTFDTTGNVGINESSPSYKLDVNGTGRFTDDLTINTTKKIKTNSSTGQLTIQPGPSYPGGSIKFAGGQSGATDRGTLIFYAGETTSLEERLRIKSDGNIGIGTNNPTAKSTTSVTHSNGAVAEAVKITTTGSYSSSNSSNAGPAISFGQFHNIYPNWITGQIAGIRRGANWDGALAFYTNSGSSQTDISEKLLITSAGDMGLGCNNPGADPAIGNDATVFEIRQTTTGNITSGNNRKGAVLRLKHEAQWENGYQSNNPNDDLGRVEFVTGDNSSGEGVRAAIRCRNLQYYNLHDLTFETVTSGSTLSEKLRITAAGNVGINTTSPDKLLEIHTTNTNTYSSSISNTPNPNTFLTLTNKAGTDGSGSGYYAAMRFQIASGATSSGWLAYHRTGDNKGAFTFKSRVSGSNYPELFRISAEDNGRIGIRNNLVTNFWDNANTLTIGDGGGSVGITFFTAGAADGSHIAFQESTGSSPEGLISYYQGGYSVANDRDCMVFKTNGTERLRITSNDEIHINQADAVAGTNGETAPLKIKSDGQYDGIMLGHVYTYGIIARGTGGDSSALIYTANAGAANLGGGTKNAHQWYSGSGGGGGPTKRMQLTSSGELGLGVDSNGNIQNRAILEIGAPYSDVSDNDGSADEGTNNHDAIMINVNGSAGNNNNCGSIVWNTGSRRRAAIMGKFQNSDDDYMGLEFFTRGTDGPGDFYTTLTLNHNGSASLVGSLSQNTSDDRLKKDKVEIPNALDKVNSLSSFTHKWNDIAVRAGMEENKEEVGLSAQEVQSIYPSLVDINNTIRDPENPTTDYLTIHYEKVVPLLVASIKELTTKNEALEARVAALEST